MDLKIQEVEQSITTYSNLLAKVQAQGSQKNEQVIQAYREILAAQERRKDYLISLSQIGNYKLICKVTFVS